jgi:hypothetical protein
MRTPDEPAPLRQHRFSVELSDLLAQDAMWAVPPTCLLDDVLAAIDAKSRA